MISRILFAILLLILGGMVYWVHMDVQHVEIIVTRSEAKIDTKLDKLQKGVARIGKPIGPPPVKYFVKKPVCFPES
jgi:hypothetical protein